MDTIHRLTLYALKELGNSYTEHEIRNICRIICTDVLHFTNIDIHLRKNEILDESFVNKFLEIIEGLKQGAPLQYLIGGTEFAGLWFGLNTDTLIPRPETRELVLWAETRLRPGDRVLDIGTGSGCIAVSLGHSRPGCRIEGTDISPRALEAAAANAVHNGVEAGWLCRDILRFEDYVWEDYDLIISNPPYVRESEKAGMERKVLDFEPERALFVPDSDPLLFYRRITEFSRIHLRPGGFLFFETNGAFARETADLLQAAGFAGTEVRRDFYGKERMVCGQKTTMP